MKIFKVAIIFTLCLHSMVSFADEAAAKKLNKLLAGAQSFSAKFEQIIVDGSGNNLQKTQGELTVKRPGLFYWRTFDPYQQLLVSDNKTTWFYDIDLEQVTIQKADNRLTHTPALLLSGDVGTLTQSFTVTEHKLGPDDIRYELTPLSQDKVFENLVLVFNKNAMVEMRMEDSLGQLTQLAFSDIKPNPKVDEKIFHFTPPKGVDVITE